MTRVLVTLHVLAQTYSIRWPIVFTSRLGCTRVAHRVTRLLQNPTELIWPVSLLAKHFLAKHFDPQAQPDRGIRWLAIRCFVLQTGMSERHLLELETMSLGEHAKDDCQVYYGEEVDGTPKEADGYSQGEEGTGV